MKKKKIIKIAQAQSAEEQTAGRCDGATAPLQSDAVTSGGHELWEISDRKWQI